MNKIILYSLATLLIIIAAIISIRLFSGEDNWICQNGQWIKHGQPKVAQPNTNCQ